MAAAADQLNRVAVEVEVAVAVAVGGRQKQVEVQYLVVEWVLMVEGVAEEAAEAAEGLLDRL